MGQLDQPLCLYCDGRIHINYLFNGVMTYYCRCGGVVRVEIEATVGLDDGKELL